MHLADCKKCNTQLSFQISDRNIERCGSRQEVFPYGRWCVGWENSKGSAACANQQQGTSKSLDIVSVSPDKLQS